ncbi:Serum paraoxonase/arylesterase 1 [Apiospora sp. TS-2023a]
MGALGNFTLGILAAILAILYQSNVHSVLYTGTRLFFGVGHRLEPLGAFPYKCRRIEDERLQACEDMWLSEATRQLFLACSEPKGRMQWGPNIAQYNASGRSLTGHVTVLDIDEPEGAGFTTRVLETPGYPGTHGDGVLNVLGMSGHDDDAEGGVRLWLIDVKPSVDPATGRVLEDQSASGGNQTVEVFRTVGGRKATELEHLETFSHPLIMTPNRVAAVGDETNAFWVVNDHGHSKNQWGRGSLAFFFSRGSVAHCTSSDGDSRTRPNCHAAIPSGLAFPNGLVHNHHDGRLYVPSSLLGTVDIYEPAPNGSLSHVKADTVDVGYSIDNLMVDRDGDVWAPVFPVGKDIGTVLNDPYGEHGVAGAAMRIRKGKGPDGGWEVEKVLEDGLGEVLPMATSVVHDAATGRLFFSGEFFSLILHPSPDFTQLLTTGLILLMAGVVSPFIAVCDRA